MANSAIVVSASLACAICFNSPDVQGSHGAFWCRTRAKQEADAAADLQRDLARIEELTVEIRWDSYCMFRFSIVACVSGFAWPRLTTATCAPGFA